MNDNERWQIEGRTRDAAKKLRAELVTLRAFFAEYSESLDNLKSTLARFLSEPSAKAPDERLLIDHVNAQQRKLSEPGFFDATAEFMEKTRKLRDLEEQIKNF